MSGKRPDIKVLVAAGASPRDAIQSALQGTFAEFAERHGFPPSAVSMCIHGRQRHERVRVALAEELRVERGWLDGLLDEASRATSGAA